MRVMAVKPRMSRNSTQTSRISLGGSVVRGEQPVDHGRRDVLAEQVGDAVARGGGGYRILELPAQAAGHDAGDRRPAASSTMLRLRW